MIEIKEHRTNCFAYRPKSRINGMLRGKPHCSVIGKLDCWSCSFYKPKPKPDLAETETDLQEDLLSAFSDSASHSFVTKNEIVARNEMQTYTVTTPIEILPDGTVSIARVVDERKKAFAERVARCVMEKYYSRKYLKEKWNSVKWDIENFLRVLDDDMPDSINPADVDRVRAEIFDKMESIKSELS
jgi:hypothetical protein